MMGFGGWGMMGLGMATMWLFWIGLTLLVVWVVARQFSGRGSSAQETALDILQQRYARGEITAAEYQNARNNLA